MDVGCVGLKLVDVQIFPNGWIMFEPQVWSKWMC